MQTKPLIDDFFNNAKSNIKPKKQDNLVKRTHYYTQENLEWIDTMAYFEKMDKSEIVRKALENFIPDKYKKKG